MRLSKYPKENLWDNSKGYCDSIKWSLKDEYSDEDM